MLYHFKHQQNIMSSMGNEWIWNGRSSRDKMAREGRMITSRHHICTCEGQAGRRHCAPLPSPRIQSKHHTTFLVSQRNIWCHNDTSCMQNGCDMIEQWNDWGKKCENITICWLMIERGDENYKIVQFGICCCCCCCGSTILHTNPYSFNHAVRINVGHRECCVYSSILIRTSANARCVS